MTKFRPCIDLHGGQVKQIVGGTLTDAGAVENFTSKLPASHFAGLYKDDALAGGHVIMLGPGNAEAAREALAAYSGGLQIGGGITAENAATWLEAGASHIIVTSWLFPATDLDFERLSQFDPAKLVVDLSCRKTDGGWSVAKDRWQTITDYEITPKNLDLLQGRCAELLIHAADVEGKQGGIDEDLVKLLGEWDGMPVTYAGGARNLGDLKLVDELSNGSIDLTIGSALDIFGGSGATYEECVGWNERS